MKDIEGGETSSFIELLASGGQKAERHAQIYQLVRLDDRSTDPSETRPGGEVAIMTEAISFSCRSSS